MVRLTRDAMRALMGAPPPPGGEQQEIERGGFWGDGGGTAADARQLVDLYYRMQEFRKRLDNQAGAQDRGADSGTHHLVDFMLAQAEILEANAKSFLETFASAHPLWPWFEAVPGIGPVLAAGLLAHLKLEPTVGHWWRFAGLDPSQKWCKSEEVAALLDQQDGDLDQRTRTVARIVGRNPDSVIRDATMDFKTRKPKSLTKAGAVAALSRIPFNRPLKTLCWKVGDQFVKLGDRKDAFYAVFYRNRKAEEVARNEAGGRRELAQATLQAKPKHAQRTIYEAGKLPDGRIDLMARRATVKLFLSHMHEVWWRLEHGEMPPRPFATTILGHAHYITPPYLESVGLE